MLVAYQQPGDTASFWGIVAESSDFCARYERDEADGYYPEDVIQGPHFTYLAPAPTPGGLWDALKHLPNGATEGSGAMHIMLEQGHIYAYPAHSGGVGMIYKPCTCDTAIAYDVITRSRSNFGALLQYCAQEGWE
jgi:hypothetical protein